MACEPQSQKNLTSDLGKIMSLKDRSHMSQVVGKKGEKNGKHDGDNTLVMSCGSATTKVGFGGDKAPSSVFPTVVGRMRGNWGMMVGMEWVDLWVGSDAHAKRGLLKLKRPVQFGIVTNWNDMEKIWEYAFKKELKRSPEKHPVVLTACCNMPKKSLEKTTTIMFETFGVPGLYSPKEEAVSLYGYGENSGTVVNMGDGKTSVCPIYGGLSVDRACQVVNIGGVDLTNYFVKILGERGYEMLSGPEVDIVQDIKEKLCYVSLNYKTELELSVRKLSFEVPKKKYAYEVINFLEWYSPLLHIFPVELVNYIYTYHRRPLEMEYSLPDGSKMTVGDELFRTPEVLFTPSLIRSESNGLHDQILSAMKKIENKELQDILFDNLFLVGGNSLFPGLQTRLAKEVGIERKSAVHACSERKCLEWIGASVLSSLNSFRKMMITKDEYDDLGSTVVHRKCL